MGRVDKKRMQMGCRWGAGPQCFMTSPSQEAKQA
jgi:hypothetical protein